MKFGSSGSFRCSLVNITVLLIALAGWGFCRSVHAIEMPADVLSDKIRGGLLGQILGNLNGLPHEMQYVEEPGHIEAYVPSLPDGAWTDDDTDFEWVYIYTMQKENTILLSPQRIIRLWKERINKGIWCSNRYARCLMDLGIEPPYTGSAVLNPWADFNISGQFICETFALLAPGMPQTAARIGLNYTRVTIDLEPSQTTQLFCTMISTAFIENDIDLILDAGIAAIDPSSMIVKMIADVRQWHRQFPGDWRETRRLIKENYSRYNGGMRDKNGYELNTASTIAALLYGQSDVSKTLMTAFNFGWDADNTAATAGAIVGVIQGYRWMLSQGWRIVDRYKNTKRENMPLDETITGFADRIIDLAEDVITDAGGERKLANGSPLFVIPVEAPANVYKLPDVRNQVKELRRGMREEIERHILHSEEEQMQAGAAYLAIGLDLAPELKRKYPVQWNQAIVKLNQNWRLLQNIFLDDDIPAVIRLREKALVAGLTKPNQKRDEW